MKIQTINASEAEYESPVNIHGYAIANLEQFRGLTLAEARKVVAENAKYGSRWGVFRLCAVAIPEMKKPAK